MPAICPKCGVDFHSPSRLTAHLARKIPCDVGKYQCEECKHRYTSWEARHRHKKICKGLQKTNDQLQEEVAELRQEVADTKTTVQNHLAIVNEASAAAAQQVIHQHQTLNINIENLHIHNSLGSENITHLKDMTLHDLKLQLSKNPSIMRRWCEILRADDEHPENHNVLLLDLNAKDAALCDEGQWKMQDRETTLFQVACKDATALYNLLARFGDEAREVRFEYLLHDVMAKAASLDKLGLKTLMDALAEPIVALTKRLYAKPAKVDNTKDLAIEELTKKMLESEQAHKRERAEYEAQLSLLKLH